MNDRVAVRATEPADVPGVVAVLHAVAAENRWIRTTADFNVADRVRFMTAAYEAGRVIGFVAEAAGTIVGEIGVRIDAGRALLGMAIVSGYRGRGIGRALMEAIIAALRERAIRGIDLQVYDHNTAAIGLYRSLGFADTGAPAEVELRADGARWQALSMTLEL